MKHLIKISILLAIASVALFSCDKKPPEEEEEELTEIIVYTEETLSQTLYADQTEGEMIVFYTTGEWTATYTYSNQPARPVPPWWLRIEPDRGLEADVYELAFFLPPNDTGADRSVTITLSCNGESVNIEITQKATLENGKRYFGVYVESGDYTYCGKAHTPNATVRIGATELSVADYTLKYVDNIDAGTASVIAEGKGNYSGSMGTGNFTIDRFPISVNADPGSKFFWETDPPLTYTTTPALFGSDILSGALTLTKTNDNDRYRITRGTLAEDGNYNITEFTEADFIIRYFHGEGTSDNPYKIDTAEQLAVLGTLATAGVYYQLSADINLNVAPYNTGAGWTPINNFRGNFDGNHRKVSGLNVNSSLNHVGLFSTISGGTVHNLTVEGEVSGHDYAGGVVGRVIDGGSVSNCISAVKVSSDFSSGGVAGVIVDGSVSNCYATGAISGDNVVGGVVGQLYNRSRVTNCYATGTVSGNYNVGGVVGGLLENSGMTNCYATGTISGVMNVGGVVGSISTNIVSNPSVINCAALNPSVGRTSGTETSFGRVSGYYSSNPNAAWKGMTVIGSTVESVNGLGLHGKDMSASEAKMQDTYEAMGWQFGSTDDSPWKMSVGGYGLPVFWWQNSAPAEMPEHLNN